MPDLIILSPCFYEDEKPAEFMLKSAKANGLDVSLYGVGDGFIPHGAHAQVLQLVALMKWRKMADYVLVTDCRDVLFTAGLSEIMAKLYERELVMSCERGCWPPDQEVVEFFHGKTPYGYDFVNAGQYIGQWDYVVHCLEFLLSRYRYKHPGADNSQGWWMWSKMREELDFDLDWGCQIFQSMSGGADQHVRLGSRPMNIVTGTFPCSVHFNGNPGVVDPHRDMYERLYG